MSRHHRRLDRRRWARVRRVVFERDGWRCRKRGKAGRLEAPGISDITAAGLIVHMTELGTLTGPRAASLTGLAPVTRESGRWKGRGFIQGGRHRVRRLLYIARTGRSPAQS